MRNRNQNQQGRYRAGATALALDTITEHPRQTVAVVMGVAAVGAIFINALFLQTAPHPAPLFAPKLPASFAAPAPARAPDPSSFSPQPRVVGAPSAPSAPAATSSGRSDPIADLIAPKRQAAVAPVAPVTPQAAVAPANAAAKKIMAAQAALAEFGYGQIKPNGVLGPETQAAVERFERERKLPATGQLSERVLRELSLVTGRALN